MILGDIIDNQLAVLRDEFLHSFAFVPPSMIHPKVNHHSIESIENISEQGQESIGISFFLLQHPMSALDRVNPTEHIKASMMLTFGQHKGLGPLFSPDPAQLRMQTKSCLIREKKNHCPFVSSYLQEFFYRLAKLLNPFRCGLSIAVNWPPQRKPQPPNPPLGLPHF